MVDISQDFGDLPITLEIRLTTLVLPERMQLGDIKAPALLQATESFLEDMRQVFDMFHHQIADD